MRCYRHDEKFFLATLWQRVTSTFCMRSSLMSSSLDVLDCCFLCDFFSLFCF
jgi:hypothetical protein